MPTTCEVRVSQLMMLMGKDDADAMFSCFLPSPDLNSRTLSGISSIYGFTYYGSCISISTYNIYAEYMPKLEGMTGHNYFL